MKQNMKYNPKHTIAMIQTICFGIIVNIVDIDEIFAIFLHPGGQTKQI